MSFVMRKAEHAIADPHYLMDIPAAALVVAPPVFFRRFGPTFSEPKREEIITDLARNVLFHAVPADEGRKGKTPYVVRRIHSSKVKDALAGKLTAELLRPVDHVGPYLNQFAEEPPVEKKVVVEKVNVYKCTGAELFELAKKYGIPDTEKISRKALQKAVIAAMEKEAASVGTEN